MEEQFKPTNPRPRVDLSKRPEIYQEFNPLNWITPEALLHDIQVFMLKQGVDPSKGFVIKQLAPNSDLYCFFSL